MPLIRIFHSGKTAESTPSDTKRLLEEVRSEFISNESIKENLSGKPVQLIMSEAEPMPHEHVCIVISGIPDGSLGRPDQVRLTTALELAVKKQFGDATFELSILRER